MAHMDEIKEIEKGTIDYDEGVEVQYELDSQEIMKGLDKLITRCTRNAEARNWSGHDEWATLKNPYFLPAKMALIHSEISEALEGDRKNLMDDKLPRYKMLTVEIGDAIIRMCHMIGYIQSQCQDNFELAKFDLPEAIIDKLEFNMQREDHKMEARNATGGKRY